MRADADVDIETSGKNEQANTVFWVLFAAMAVLVGRGPGDGAGDGRCDHGRGYTLPV
jgi:hypothetical protein